MHQLTDHPENVSYMHYVQASVIGGITPLMIKLVLITKHCVTPRSQTQNNQSCGSWPWESVDVMYIRISVCCVLLVDQCFSVKFEYNWSADQSRNKSDRLLSPFACQRMMQNFTSANLPGCPRPSIALRLQNCGLNHHSFA